MSVKADRIPRELMEEIRQKLGGITPQAVYERIGRIRRKYKPPISLVEGACVLAADKTDIDLHQHFSVEQVDRTRALIAVRSGAPVASPPPIVIHERAPKEADKQRGRTQSPVMTDKEKTEYLKREFNYTRRKLGKKLKKICGDQEQLRAILLRDICDAVRCYAHGLWKPAVILCGGALEGILSEPILRQPDAIRDAAYLKAYPQTKQAKKMENYRLCHYLDVAAELKVIRETTAKLGHGVRDYRNYIHPLTEIEEKQEITDNDARIACTLVFKILEEVGK
jgi:hypothetical protein